MSTVFVNVLIRYWSSGPSNYPRCRLFSWSRIQTICAFF